MLKQFLMNLAPPVQVERPTVTDEVAQRNMGRAE